jgi:hypothetical protein
VEALLALLEEGPLVWSCANICITPFRWSILVGLVIIVGLSVGAWFLSPKGENQTYGVSSAMDRESS